MPYLGDFLGQLLSEITVARMHADLETVRLAELYASHPLMKYMPVPHLRMPDVDVEIPVVMKQPEEPRGGESPRGGAKVKELRARFASVLDAHLSRARLAVPTADRQRLDAALDESATRLSGPSETSVDVNRIADAFTETVTRALGGAVRLGAAPAAAAGPGTSPPPGAARPPGDAVTPAPSGADGDFARALREAARMDFLKARAPPPRLMALVTTSEVREAGTPEHLTRLRIKVSEQAVEWTTVESEGRRQERLVPE